MTKKNSKFLRSNLLYMGLFIISISIIIVLALVSKQFKRYPVYIEEIDLIDTSDLNAKVLPDDRGGVKIPHTDKKIFEVLNNK